MKTENENEIQEEKAQKLEDSMKITISRAAEKMLSDVVSRVNENFEGGRVSRQTVASWLLETACTDLSDEDVKSIRSSGFDELVAFAALNRRIQETGQLPPELRQYLISSVGLGGPSQKKTRNKLTKDGIIDRHASETEVA